MPEPFDRYAVIMAGGHGERFWPLSSPGRPKQLLRIADPKRSLLGLALDRAQLVVPLSRIYIATSVDLVGPIARDIPEFPREQILAEPCKRNTSGALSWATANILARAPESAAQGSIAVLASDHIIQPAEDFQQTLQAAFEVAESSGALGTIGIKPTRPETGYGYIEVDTLRNITADIACFYAQSFHEKPSAIRANEYLQDGRYYWNSGMFIWTIGSFLEELSHAAPALANGVKSIAEALAKGQSDQARVEFEALPDISIDFALMERARNVSMTESSFSWDDLGSWDSLRRALPVDHEGNLQIGDAAVLDSKNCLVVNDSSNQLISVLGAEDMVVVATEKAILVCPASRAQEVRKMVRHLESQNRDRV